MAIADREREERRLRAEEARIRAWQVDVLRVLEPGLRSNLQHLSDLDADAGDALEAVLARTPRCSSHTPEHDGRYLFGKLHVFLSGWPGRSAWSGNLHIRLSMELVFAAMGEPSRWSEASRVLEGVRHDDPPMGQDVPFGRARAFLASLSAPLVSYRAEKGAYEEIALPESIQRKLPRGFARNPTAVIEAAPVVERSIFPHASTRDYQKAAAYAFCPYDWSRLHQLGDVVFKRVDLNKVQHALEEPTRSAEVDQVLRTYVGLDPRVRVLPFHGHVVHAGNIYLVAPLIPNAMNMHERPYRKVFEAIRMAAGEAHVDLAPRNVVVQYASARRRQGEEVAFWLLDFETVHGVSAP